MPKLHVAVLDLEDNILKMAEEFQKYKDILKREQEEFRKQFEREVSTLKFLLLRLKWTILWTK